MKYLLIVLMIMGTNNLVAEECLFSNGVVLAKEKKYEEAIACFQKVPKESKQYVSALYNAGYLSLKQQLNEQGISLLKEVANKDKTHSRSRLALGRYYLQHGKYTEAVSYLEKTVELATEHAEAYSLLGAAYYRQKEFHKAEEALLQSIALRDTDALTHFNLAMVQQMIGKGELSDISLKRTLALDPDFMERPGVQQMFSINPAKHSQDQKQDAPE